MINQIKQIHEENKKQDVREELLIDCKNCSGLCCVALFFSKMDGFPKDKEAGEACVNLRPDFTCSIHSELVNRKMKGCLSYDCFGAGQKVTAKIYRGENWSSTIKKEEIFEVFLVVHKLHQMLWYLVEAKSILVANELWEIMDELILENQTMTDQMPEEILNIEIEQYRIRVNKVLKRVSQLVRDRYCKKIGKTKKTDLMGQSFKNENLDGEDFSMTLLIATNLEGCSLVGTNFLGADMRDTNLKNANVSESIFLTQGQINAAKGDRFTQLPARIQRPVWWN
ncbi:MAG: pentapeptide repeat-containing protein [Velocimicrobium sp.]